MSQTAFRTIPIAAAPSPGTDGSRSGRKARAHLKGRQATPAAIEAVRALIGQPPASGHRRDLLIEHLHTINDAHRGLPEALIVALAAEMRLPVVEVFEVASFYHHFDIVREGDTPAALTVRVCDGLSCSLEGAGDLLDRLPALLGTEVRVIPAPCVGRCEQAPAVQVGQRAVAKATLEAVVACAAVPDEPPAAPHPDFVGYAAYRAGVAAQHEAYEAGDPQRAMAAFLARRRRD